MERDRHTAQAAGQHDAGVGEAAEADDDVGPQAADEPQAETQPLGLLPVKPELHQRAPAKGRARHALEGELRVFPAQPGVHLLVADEQRGRVAARDQRLGQGDAGREVAAGAAAGDDEGTHGVTSGRNPKRQIPNPKQAPSTKPREACFCRFLNSSPFVWRLAIGVWDLVFTR
jgi:hypothetical protein